MDDNLILWMQDIRREDSEEIGEKVKTIAEICNAGFPVPPGFVITSKAFLGFLEENEIKDILRNLLKEVNKENYAEIAEKVQRMILDAGLAAGLRKEIIESYSNLNVNLDVFKMVNRSTLSMIKSGRELPYVAVRSSLIGEKDYNEKPLTLLNIRGGSNIIKAVQECWASLYSEKALLERLNNNVPQTSVSAAVLIQRQVNSEKSGVIFTTHEQEGIVGMLIEAGFGYGESIVLNQINPDRYLVDKNNLELKGLEVNKQDFMYTRDETMERTKKMNLDVNKASGQVLAAGEIKALARLGNEIEKFYNNPRYVEFALENGKMYIIQAKGYQELKKPHVKKDELQGEEKQDYIEIKVPEQKTELLENSESLFKMFDNDISSIMQPENVQAKIEEKKEQIYNIHSDDKKREDRVSTEIAGVKIELPRTKEGLRIARQILELIEGQL
ncbi:MAG TPA: PEP/pyruvate-binding domain-containing protein [Candidatus Nanoarchaeia archaeon]|nr:PEP/pyruvate-binding domain-containing protein [Candidatus Nanoarchaeia archaeon]